MSDIDSDKPLTSLKKYILYFFQVSLRVILKELEHYFKEWLKFSSHFLDQELTSLGEERSLQSDIKKKSCTLAEFKFIERWMYDSSDCGTCLTTPVCCYSLQPLVNNCFYSIHFSRGNRHGNHYVLYFLEIIAVVHSMVTSLSIFHSFFFLNYAEPQKKHHNLI